MYVILWLSWTRRRKNIRIHIPSYEAIRGLFRTAENRYSEYSRDESVWFFFFFLPVCSLQTHNVSVTRNHCHHTNERYSIWFYIEREDAGVVFWRIELTIHTIALFQKTVSKIDIKRFPLRNHSSQRTLTVLRCSAHIFVSNYCCSVSAILQNMSFYANYRYQWSMLVFWHEINLKFVRNCEE